MVDNKCKTVFNPIYIFGIPKNKWEENVNLKIEKIRN
jgi:hypothetical protein